MNNHNYNDDYNLQYSFYFTRSLVLILLITWVLAFLYNFCAFYLVHSHTYYNELTNIGGSRVCDPSAFFTCQEDSLITLYKNSQYSSVMIYFLGGVIGSTCFGTLIMMVNLFWSVPLALIGGYIWYFSDKKEQKKEEEKEKHQRKSNNVKTINAVIL